VYTFLVRYVFEHFRSERGLYKTPNAGGLARSGYAQAIVSSIRVNGIGTCHTK
jgi:hypothetical protein